MKRRVVITGIGCVTAGGIGVQPFWERLLQGHSCISTIDAFDTSNFPIKRAGIIRDLDLKNYVSAKLLQQTDRHTQLALAATHLALEDAALDLQQEDHNQVGTIIGNNLGGSIFGEGQLLNLHTQGARAVSPYQSIAWFYAATIGQISIKYALKGYSKTYVADSAGSHFALGDALRAIQRGDLDICLAGGCEAPISPYALAGYIDADILSREAGAHAVSQTPEHFAPFDSTRNGLILGEGSAMLILEDYEHAQRRNARIYAELCGFGQTCDGMHYQHKQIEGRQYARAMTLALHESEARTGEIGFIAADGAAGHCADIREAHALRQTFGNDLEHLKVSCPKTIFGHLMGGSGAVDTAIACLSLYYHYIPPTIEVKDIDPTCSVPLVTHEAVRNRGTHALILGTARGGMNAALVVRTNEGGSRL